jgi:hypothetical protein
MSSFTIEKKKYLGLVKDLYSENFKTFKKLKTLENRKTSHLHGSTDLIL